MTLVLAVHLVVVVAVLLTGRRLGRAVLLLGGLAPLTTLIWALAAAPEVLGGARLLQSIGWVDNLGLQIDLVVDSFSLMMVFLVSAIGVLVFGYGSAYFSERNDLAGFTASLVGFAGAMLGIVLSDNVLVLFVFWEITSITSFLLIGFDDRSANARASALKALLVTGSGGLAMLAGFVLLAQEARTFSLSGILEAAPATGLAAVGVGLVLVGAFAKSAQFPFHFWLPGAMAAPTPVSAYLHSATMVKAGVYMIARFAPVFAPLFAYWRPLLVAVGATTMILGGWRALGQGDIKQVLAMGTVSQLGFITVLVGYGDPRVTVAGTAMIFAHAVFKAALFMVVGIVDKQTGTRRLAKLAGWGRTLPTSWWIAVAAAASMVGLPPLVGFVAKEEAIRDLLLARGGNWALAAVIVGSILTVAYSLRFFEGSRDAPEPEGPVASAASPSFWFMLSPLILVVISVATGVAPRLVEGLIVGAASALSPEVAGSHLELWHGIEPALLWSMAVMVVGYVLWRLPRTRAHELSGQVPEMARVYNESLRLLNRVADRITSVVQNGSLPVYLQVILATAVLLPGFILVRSWVPNFSGALVDSPLRLVVVAVVVIAAIGTLVAQRRMGAVLFLGAVGYGVAVLFVLHGAPDLALTQMLVETLAVAMFVMVLRHLPDRWETVRWPVSQTSRIIISVSVGLLVGSFALWTAASRVASPISHEYVERALPDGGGGNVVNVILTDFRGFDTMGEIFVIGMAAIGCMVLLGRARSRPHPPEEEAS